MSDLLGNIQYHIAGLSEQQQRSGTVNLLKLAANEINELQSAARNELNASFVTVSLKQNINVNEPTNTSSQKLEGTSKPETKASLDAWAKEQAATHEKARKECVKALAQKRQEKQQAPKSAKTTEELMTYITVHLAYLTGELTSEKLRPVIEHIYKDGNRTNAEIIQSLIKSKKTDQDEFEFWLIFVIVHVLLDELLEAMNSGL